MISRLLRWLWECQHELSWPISMPDPRTKKCGAPYQVCMKCGDEFPYTGELKAA